MEIIIGSVLFKAFMKGTQNASCKGKLKINKPAIPSVLENSSLKKQIHNLPGTPPERLSLETTVILYRSLSNCLCYQIFETTFKLVLTEYCFLLSLFTVHSVYDHNFFCMGAAILDLFC